VDHLVTWLRAQWDRALGIALLAVGGLLVIFGWVAISGASNISDQLSYLASGAVGGLFCLGAGAGLLVSANLSDEWRKLDELVGAVRDATADAKAESPAAAPDHPSSAPGQAPQSHQVTDLREKASGRR
jgi:hypothetical protein